MLFRNAFIHPTVSVLQFNNLALMTSMFFYLCFVALAVKKYGRDCC